ncbi:hypothetical protein LB533_20625 [Mesorhizobium sp. BR1-1-13]|uniref:hypothetical protein n=1 Tax=Mesorhizobium sp. BR1-1-13 TaxID=2876656 RepID=UPI001CD0A321|nr:hypothetical protein [Mesorhizobium sp. BR1-1-13]MBZ9943495.1 hypothetical protein [Mesorhizobium sp. BR1-1-13]
MWFLIIAIGGFAGVSDVKTIGMTQAQCREAVTQLLPLRSALGAVCVGPNGEKFTFEDVA